MIGNLFKRYELENIECMKNSTLIKLYYKIISMPMVEAISIYCSKIKIPKKKFQFRISAYGIIKHDGKILFVNTKSLGKRFLGSGVEIGEGLEDSI